MATCVDSDSDDDCGYTGGINVYVDRLCVSFLTEISQ